MRGLWRMGVAAATLAGFLMAGAGAQADTVARWIQIAPGSTAASPTVTNFGDAPFSTTNTVLARAIITGGACPVATLDDGTSLPMSKRFDGATLAGTAILSSALVAKDSRLTPGSDNPTPGAVGATNGKIWYPQYFINANATATSKFGGVNGGPLATSSWTECEAVVPPASKAKKATIDGVDLKLPVANPQRILVIADTGCRMNNALTASGANQQNCQNATQFPLQYLANYEATFKPDLVVLVGDIFYRDTSCLDAFPGCNNPAGKNYETWGDTFDSWNADFFFPAKTLLAAAPWAIARGNHESCGRGARGWFALLDPHPYSLSNVLCAPAGAADKSPTGTAPNLVAHYHPDFTPTFVVPIGPGVNLLVHDSSLANDGAIDTAIAQNYDAELTALLATPVGKATNVFASHKPVFGLAGNYNSGTAGVGIRTAVDATHANITDNAGDFTEQATFTGTYANSAFNSTLTKGLPASIGLFLHGHIHQLQYIKGMPHFPPTLVVGIGGDLLDADYLKIAAGQTRTTPLGNIDYGNYVQKTGVAIPYTNPAVQMQSLTFKVNSLSQADYKTAITTNESFTKALSHDEFGFAVLDATYNFNTMSGFAVSAYKMSSAKAGKCVITLGTVAKQNRDITCDF